MNKRIRTKYEIEGEVREEIELNSKKCKTDTDSSTVKLSPEFISECEQQFKSNPINAMARNMIVSTGSLFASTNSNRSREISHIFLNSVKKPNVKATNQGHSGRCWMFSALNTFRHLVIDALQLTNFEFSETYLFFWDKLERSNSYITWFIKHPDEPVDGHAFQYMINGYLSDGGWFNTFSNLIQKYGIVPSSAMTETYQSVDTEDMNNILHERLNSCVNFLRSDKGKKLSSVQQDEIRQETMKNVYEILSKFLGEPPKEFTWSFTNEEGESTSISKLTPIKFFKLVIPSIDISDFVPISSIPIPSMKFNQNYRVKYTSNTIEGKECSMLNMKINELSKYAMKSIENGLSVWFVADVSKHFNPIHSALDDQLDNSDLLFGKAHEFSKGDRITFGDVKGNHAMALTGFNVDSTGKPISWQVENSWGYSDNETPGMDGFLYMSHSWFEKYVTEIVVHKSILSRTVLKLLDTDVIELNPWDSVAPAIRAGDRSMFQTAKRIKLRF